MLWRCALRSGQMRSATSPKVRTGKRAGAKRGFCSRPSQNEDTSGYSTEKQTHFGFRDNVTEAEKKAKVLDVFDNVAESYDKMNDAMSFGVHRIWKDSFVNELDPPADAKILDVAGGTGDIAFRLLDRLGVDGHVTVCDINSSMLEVGKRRAGERGLADDRVRWVIGDAQNLDMFDNDSFDAYTIAFGIRNVVDIEKALREAFRVVKPGGRFLCLEFSHVENPIMSSAYEAYSFNVIPPMGKVLAGDWDSYQYLVESIRRFPTQDRFADLITEAGFSFTRYDNLTLGVAAIHSGFKIS